MSVVRLEHTQLIRETPTTPRPGTVYWDLCTTVPKSVLRGLREGVVAPVYVSHPQPVRVLHARSRTGVSWRLLCRDGRVTDFDVYLYLFLDLLSVQTPGDRYLCTVLRDPKVPSLFGPVVLSDHSFLILSYSHLCHRHFRNLHIDSLLVRLRRFLRGGERHKMSHTVLLLDILTYIVVNDFTRLKPKKLKNIIEKGDFYWLVEVRLLKVETSCDFKNDQTNWLETNFRN